MTGNSVKSMTGFGKATSRLAGKALTVEITSRNGQALSINTRLPDTLAGLSLELLADTAIRGKTERGTVMVAARLEAGAGRGELNIDVAERYEAAIRRLMKQLRLPSREDARMLATLPGVLEQQDACSENPERVRRQFSVALAGALARMHAARAREGAKTEKALRSLLKTISARLKAVSQAAPRAVAASRERLIERVRVLLQDTSAQIAPADVAREISLLADKMDITEEIVRLGTHVEEFRNALSAGESPGRKLEFLAQEMLREASTMGAKANDAKISHLVVDIKTEIKRLRELVQNLE